MGDHCHLTASVYGLISNISQWDDLVEAMQNDSLATEFGDDMRGYARTALNAISQGTSPSFKNDSCNYATVDDFEGRCQLHGLAYSIDHGDGCDYPAGAKSWSQEHGEQKVGEVDGDILVDIDKLREIFSSGSVEKLGHIIMHADRARGVGFPKFEVSLEVKAHLELIVAEAEAAKIKSAAKTAWKSEVTKGETLLSFDDWAATQNLMADPSPQKVYVHSQYACPSNHNNEGDDICSDCGLDLNS